MMEPEKLSQKKIFKIFLGVIISDLVTASFLILFMLPTTQFQLGSFGNLHSILITFGVILFVISIVQGLVLIPTALICLIQGKWELAMGYILGMLAIAFLSFTLCSYSFIPYSGLIFKK